MTNIQSSKECSGIFLYIIEYEGKEISYQECQQRGLLRIGVRRILKAEYDIILEQQSLLLLREISFLRFLLLLSSRTIILKAKKEVKYLHIKSYNREEYNNKYKKIQLIRYEVKKQAFA